MLSLHHILANVGDARTLSNSSCITTHSQMDERTLELQVYLKILIRLSVELKILKILKMISIMPFVLQKKH